MSKPPRKRSWSQPLADLVGAAIDPVLARQGFGEHDLILHWEDIVGSAVATYSRPIKLQWPPRVTGRSLDQTPATATLVVRVDGGFALDLQHRADQVLSRVNAHLGWRCVGKLSLKQGPIEQAADERDRRREPDRARLSAVSDSIADVEDEALRAALARLGAHVLS